MPPGGQQQGGFGTPGQGPLDWRMALQAIQRANPGAPPNVLAAAVDGMIPMMTLQSQQQWREQRLMLQEAGQRETHAHHVAQETEADKRIAQGDERIAQGDRKIALGEASLKLREKWRDRDYELKRAQLEQRIQEAKQRGDQRQAQIQIAALRALIDAKHKEIGEQIKAATSGFQAMDKDAQKALKEEQEKLFNEDLDSLRKLGGRTTPTGGTTAKPEKKIDEPAPKGKMDPISVPEAFNKDPDGTTYEKDGKTWTKQGDKLVPGPQSEVEGKTKIAMDPAEQRRMQKRIENADDDKALIKIRKDLEKRGIDPDSIPQLQIGSLSG
jgi:hypothetical protein